MCIRDSYYKRSTDSGATWGAEVQLNDVGTNDQFFPSVSVGATNTVAAAWYDRRDDVGNLRIRYYRRMSFDGGATWGANVQVTDADSPVVIDAGLANIQAHFSFAAASSALANRQDPAPSARSATRAPSSLQRYGAGGGGHGRGRR